MKWNEEEHNQMNNKIKVECLKAKEQWPNNKCQKLSELEHTNSKLFYSTLKDISRKNKSLKSRCLRDKDGNILMNTDDIKKRWVEYVGDLYADPGRGKDPPVLQVETRARQTERRSQGCG